MISAHRLAHIVAGWDGSAGAAHAVVLAARLAQANAGRLDVVHVWDDRGQPSTPDPRVNRAVADAALEEQVRPLIPVSWEVSGEMWVEAGHASAVLEDLAASADLLVIGRGHQSRVGLGGRAGHLIHNTVTPTAVVPASDFGSVEQVVVGVDGSEMSVRAAVWAHDQADVLGVPLKAVYAWTDPYDEMRWWGEEDRQTRDALVAAADRTLTSVAGALHRERPASSVDMSTMWVEHEPVVGLLDIARDGSVLVVGSHGYGGVGRLVLGSVALSLVTHATVPIVVVRPEAVV